MCQHNLPCSIVYAHCLLPGRAFASLYVLLFLEKEAEIGGRYLNKNSAKSLVFFWCFFVCCFVFYFIKISKFALPGVMLMYERTSKDRKKEDGKDQESIQASQDNR